MSDQQKASARSGATSDPKSDAKRQAALQGALTQIERQFGKGTVMRMGDPGARVAVDAIPTGALSLDIALGIGGVPRGRIVEIFGPESSGKTTLVYHLIAEAQKLDGVRAFVDAEHAMDPLYAREIGVDIDELLVSQPDYGEQALEIVDMLIRSGAGDVIAVGSVAALTRRGGAGYRRRAAPRGGGGRGGGGGGRGAAAAGRARGADGRPDRRRPG